MPPVVARPCLKVLTALLLALAGFNGPALAGDPFELEWRKLADGVWAGVRPTSYNPPVVGSTVIVIGETGVFVFDPAGFALQGERLVEKVSELTETPITHMAISHWHGDHSMGTYKALEAFPEAEVITHEFTARVFPAPLMGDYSPPDEAATQATRERVQKALDTGFRSDGTPVTEKMREYYRYLLDNLDLMNAELGRVEIVTPTKTMTDRMIIDLGGRTVELIHLGRGNTRGDIMMHLPEERIIATGDAVVRPTPYGFGSYPRSWAQVLREVKALNPRIIVPGHGEIMEGDFAYLDLLIETFELVADQAEAFAAQGKSLEEARAEMDFSSVEERFTGGEPLLAFLFNAWFKQPIAKAAYNDATGVENENPDKPLSP